jgi:hypothetical protein
MSSAAQLAKEKGNDAFKDGDYLLAHSYYTDAISADPSEYSFPLNRAIANLKLQRWQEAEEDATTVLELSPVDTKAYYRRCLARREQGNLIGARQDIAAFVNIGGDKKFADEQIAFIAAAESPPAISQGFIVSDSPGKGLGVFSNQTFYRGDLILAERPLYKVNNPDNSGPTYQRNIIDVTQRLSESDTNLLLSLKNTHAGGRNINNPALGAHLSNAFAVGDNMTAICMVASRFNHSCSPNARYSWHEATGQLRIFALHEIAVREEICVSYIAGRNVYGSCRDDRRNRLKGQGFTCACVTCILPQPEVTASDKRRMEIAKIWESIPRYSPRRTPDRLRAIVRALRLLQKEGYWADADDFTIDAAAICAGYSDWESTKYWATKTYETRVAEFGEDSHRVAEVLPVYLNPKSSEGAATLWKEKFNIRL